MLHLYQPIVQSFTSNSRWHFAYSRERERIEQGGKREEGATKRKTKGTDAAQREDHFRGGDRDKKL